MSNLLLDEKESQIHQIKNTNSKLEFEINQINAQWKNKTEKLQGIDLIKTK